MGEMYEMEIILKCMALEMRAWISGLFSVKFLFSLVFSLFSSENTAFPYNIEIRLSVKINYLTN